MNIYVVVEGEVGEKKVYQHWIPLVNPILTPIDYITQVTTNNFYIISGNGYPNYFNTIKNAIDDVANNPQFNRLVVAVDSEDIDFATKYTEIDDYIQSFGTSIDYRIIIQHFCLETWALGNKNIYVRNPQDTQLIQFQSIWNVSTQDPELLPPLVSHLNRAHSAELYLRKLLQEKYRNLTYTKRRPEALLNNTFFNRVKNRCTQDRHVQSFEHFLNAFI